MASLESGAIPHHRRCFMRLLDTVAAAILFLGPLTVLAQHAVAPTPAPSIPIASHTPSVIPPVTHSSSIPHGPGTTSLTGAQGARAVALRSSSKLDGSHANDRGSLKSSPNSQPQKVGVFSFLHRQPGKCKRGSCAAPPVNSLISQNYSFPPAEAEGRLSCRVFPVANPAIPCNMFFPCCP